MTKPWSIGFRCPLVTARLLAALALALAAGVSVAQAQSKLDELEKKLEQARKNPKKPAEAKPAAPAPAPAPAGGRLVVEVDAPCELRVNGTVVRQLQAGSAEVVPVGVGEQLVECVSSQNASARVRKVLTVQAGQQLVVELEMAKDVRWRVEGDTMTDTTNGLQWTRDDNGGNIRWREAQAYCQGKGGGWGLPTVAQLRDLYNAGAVGRFRRTGSWYWSSELNGSSEAWSVNLDLGQRGSFLIGYGDLKQLRALCVRRP